MDYSTLSETLTVRKDVHTSSSVTDIIKDDKDLEKAYDELWKQIQEIQSKLQPGEELWIGNLEVTDKTEKTDIIKYFTTAISPENMSKDELIKALQEQERVPNTKRPRRTTTPAKRRASITINLGAVPRSRLLLLVSLVGITIQTIRAKKSMSLGGMSSVRIRAMISATSILLPAPSWICCRTRTVRSIRPTACW